MNFALDSSYECVYWHDDKDWEEPLLTLAEGFPRIPSTDICQNIIMLQAVDITNMELNSVSHLEWAMLWAGHFRDQLV